MAIVKSLNAKKTGHDLIEVKMVIEAWPVIQLAILGLFISCLTEMVFLSQYKRAQIKVLLKGEGKDRTNRPISLLTVIGKILEKIADRLKAIVNSHPCSSPRQYGFCKGRSTEDEII